MKIEDFLFALFSIIILFLLIITAYYEHEPEWEKYQREYHVALASMTNKKVSPKELENISRKIQQDWIPELGVVDRCRSCHIAIDNPAFANYEQPLRSHPPMPRHPATRFGCTPCHQGQGRATIKKEAHGYAENWEYPLLPENVLEGSCGKCHRVKNFQQTPVLTAGRRLMEKAGCIGCHFIKNWDKPAMLAPDLMGMGSKVSAQWLFRWLKRPRDYLSASLMPNFHLTDEEALKLTAWLMNSKIDQMEPYPGENLSERQLDELYNIGRTRFRESRCISCHSVEGKGETLGPELGRIADKVNKQWLYSWLKNPKTFLPHTRMPHFSFPEQDIVAIVEYMFAEFSSFEEQPATVSVNLHKFTPAMVNVGKELGRHYGCYGCHSLPDNVTGGEIGVELTEIGSKELSQLAFGKTTIDRSLPNWLFVKLRNPTIFSSDLKMPDYEFTAEQAEKITAALMGLTTKNIIASYTTALEKTNDYQPNGPFGRLVDEYRCLSCHAINGQGGDLAVDLSIEGSQVQADWLFDYLKLPYAIRPTLTARMPRLKISDEKAKVIVDYIMLVLRDDRIPEHIGELTKSMAIKGEQLYKQKYACWSCHIIGTKGGGYYGPALTNVGKRLTPGWIYRRLKNPQAFEPNTKEPNFNIPDNELKALTAFLMTLKGEN